MLGCVYPIPASNFKHKIPTMKKCYIIAGAPSPDLDFLRSSVPTGAFVLCADRGYTYAEAAGISPSVIVGDFDSCASRLPAGIETVTLQREKLYTDTVHCIDNALEKGYDEIVVFAAVGGRLDHTVANLYALEYANQRGGSVTLLSEREEIRLLTGGKHSFEGLDGLTFSLFPLGCESAVLSISGAHYPLDRYRYESRNPVGVSNIFEGGRSEIEVHSGKLLLIINRDDRNLQF